eukprot:jgi/Tetstr1/433249/TSEL_022537.t1
METFSLLNAGPLFQEARVKAIMTVKELASPAVMRSVSQLAVLGHMYKRLQGAAWFVTRWGLQNVVTEEDGPERKAQVDALTSREGRTRYLADITVYARMAEGNGFVSLLVSNLHSAVCRMICQMLACGHPLIAELWMENLMGFLKAGAKRVLPKNVCETMMRDLLFAQQIHRLKAHRLYREPNPNKKTPIRLVGSASAAWEDAVDFKDHLEMMLDDVRPVALGGLLAYKAASLRNGDKPRLHQGGDDGETSRDNSFFVYKMLKQVLDADPPPYTTEELESEEELPRKQLAEREDAKYTTMVARAQHFYLATPPPPPGLTRTTTVPARGPFGLHCVAVLMAPAHISSAKAAGLGVDAGELVVVGIHARSQDGACR